MTYSDDPFNEMNRFPTVDEAERLLVADADLAGRRGEGAELASLLATLRSTDTRGNTIADERAIATIAAEIRATPVDVTAPIPIGRARRGRISTKATVIAFAAVLASGTAAAAANGSLPPSVQRAVGTALSHVNISVPRPPAPPKGPVPDPKVDAPPQSNRPAGTSPPADAVANNADANGNRTTSADAGQSRAGGIANGAANSKKTKTASAEQTKHVPPGQQVSHGPPASTPTVTHPNNGNGGGNTNRGGNGKGKAKAKSDADTNANGNPGKTKSNGNGNGNGANTTGTTPSGKTPPGRAKKS